MTVVTEDGLVVPHVAHIGPIRQQERKPETQCFWVTLTGGKGIMVEAATPEDLKRKRTELVAAVHGAWANTVGDNQ